MGDKETVTTDPVRRLLAEPIAVANVGLESFAENLRLSEVAVVQLDWSPPASGDPELADLVARLGA